VNRRVVRFLRFHVCVHLYSCAYNTVCVCVYSCVSMSGVSMSSTRPSCSVIALTCVCVCAFVFMCVKYSVCVCVGCVFVCVCMNTYPVTATYLDSFCIDTVDPRRLLAKKGERGRKRVREDAHARTRGL